MSDALQRLRAWRANIAIVLGSGLSSIVPDDDETISYSDFGELPETSVPGHAGRFVLGKIDNTPVIFAQGRVHLYEGFTARLVTANIRILAEVGIGGQLKLKQAKVALIGAGGLGAPLGAVLCGSAAFIDRAWQWKQRLGGSLRQGGICAAACTYALDHNIGRLAEDHANARVLATGLAQLPELTVEEPETNLVFFDTRGAGMTADELAELVRQDGIQVSTVGKYRVRACTHLDVDRAGIDLALQVIRKRISN